MLTRATTAAAAPPRRPVAAAWSLRALQVGDRPALQPVVAVEVDQAVLETQGAAGDQRASRPPPRSRRPASGQARSGARASTVGEVDADRAVPHRPDRERRPPAGPARRPRRPRSPTRARDVDVGGLEDAGPVELAEQPGRARDEAPVVVADGLEQLGHRALPAGPSRPVEQVGQVLDQGDRRPPGEDPARLAVDERGVRPAHAAQVEVEHAAEVASPGRSRAAASAGSGAARRRTAAPGAGSRSGPSPRRAPPGGSRGRSAARRPRRASWSCSRPRRSAAGLAGQPQHDVDASR